MVAAAVVHGLACVLASSMTRRPIEPGPCRASSFAARVLTGKDTCQWHDCRVASTQTPCVAFLAATESHRICTTRTGNAWGPPDLARRGEVRAHRGLTNRGMAFPPWPMLRTGETMTGRARRDLLALQARRPGPRPTKMSKGMRGE